MVEGWRPGSRRPVPTGKFTENRESWVRLNTQQYILYKNPQDTRTMEPGEEYIILIISNRREIKMNLSGMTQQELLALKTFLNRAFDMAEPICEERDRAANEAFEATGDDSFVRLYRRAPEFVIRRGKVGQHTSGIPSGSEPDPSVGEDGRDPDRRPGGYSGEVVELDAPGGQAEDNSSSDHQLEELRVLGETGRFPDQLLGPDAGSSPAAPDPGGDHGSASDDGWGTDG